MLLIIYALCWPINIDVAPRARRKSNILWSSTPIIVPNKKELQKSTHHCVKHSRAAMWLVWFVLWIELCWKLAGNRSYARVCVPLGQLVWWWEYFNNSKRIQQYGTQTLHNNNTTHNTVMHKQTHVADSWQLLFWHFFVAYTGLTTHINYYLSVSPASPFSTWPSRLPLLNRLTVCLSVQLSVCRLVWIINYWNFCGWRLFCIASVWGERACVRLLRACVTCCRGSSPLFLLFWYEINLWSWEMQKYFDSPTGWGFCFRVCGYDFLRRDTRFIFVSIANATFSSWQAIFLSFSLRSPSLWLSFFCSFFFLFAGCNQAWHANKCGGSQGDSWSARSRWWRLKSKPPLAALQ